MASMMEIQDPSNLRYDTDLGYTQNDSGFGPPSGPGGWIRTGGTASSGNCLAWTSAAAGDSGTMITPWDSVNWEGTGTRNSPWVSGGNTCQAPRRVWCVQD